MFLEKIVQKRYPWIHVMFIFLAISQMDNLNFCHLQSWLVPYPNMVIFKLFVFVYHLFPIQTWSCLYLFTTCFLSKHGDFPYPIGYTPKPSIGMMATSAGPGQRPIKPQPRPKQEAPHGTWSDRNWWWIPVKSQGLSASASYSNRKKNVRFPFKKKGPEIYLEFASSLFWRHFLWFMKPCFLGSCFFQLWKSEHQNCPWLIGPSAARHRWSAARSYPSSVDSRTCILQPRGFGPGWCRFLLFKSCEAKMFRKCNRMIVFFVIHKKIKQKYKMWPFHD